MKFLGSGLIWIGFLLMGMRCSTQYKKRCEVYNELVLLCENIYNQIAYFMKPLEDIMLEIYSSGICANLTFLSELNQQTDTDFPLAWKKAVYTSDMPLRNVERDVVFHLGASLGSADSDVQLKILAYYCEYFKSEAKKVQIKKEKYSGTSLLVWCLCGSAVLILYL